MADETQKAGDGAGKVNTDAEEKLLKQIREDFRYVKEYWRENYEEAEKDMRIAACLPPVEFEEDRKDRPCIWPDEISQYVKQSNNNLRQNKRSAKISPRSEQAKDEDAEHRQAYIRGIEYASRAQSIYSTAFESCTECAFGFWRINCRVTGPNGEQEPRLVRIPNQFTAYLDPDAKERDFSDGNIGFVLDRMRQTAFARKYRKAKKRSFTGTDTELAPDWFSGEDIIVAEYWCREEIEAEDGEKTYKVTQYITNGVEVLETNEWIGSWIPIIGVFGEEMYVRTGGQSKRMFLSLIRRARAPQTMLAYIASQEAQEFGMAPQAPFMVIRGSVDPDKWKDAHRIPQAYLEFFPPMDWNVQTMGPVPAPSRPQFMPNAQAYQISRESWRRAIQAAMGLTPLPTSAQRQNEKSGIALEKIQNQEAIGSFHFIDNFVGALCNSTRQIDELITKLAELDSLPKQLLGKDQKDEDLTLHVVPRAQAEEFMRKIEERKQAQAANPASEHLNEADYFFAHRGQFEVTIADGPNKESEREERMEFADTIFQTVTNLAQVLPPGAVAKLLALAVRMKNVGSFGDEIADVLDPKQAQQQLQQAQQAAQEMQAEIQKLQLEKAGKVLDNEYKMHVEQMRLSVEQQIAQLNADLKAYIANVTTKAQSIAEREKLFQETQIENHHAAHEAGLQASDQAHARDTAASAAATQQAAQVADQQHQQTLAAQPPPTEPQPGSSPGA